MPPCAERVSVPAIGVGQSVAVSTSPTMLDVMIFRRPAWSASAGRGVGHSAACIASGGVDTPPLAWRLFQCSARSAVTLPARGVAHNCAVVCKSVPPEPRAFFDAFDSRPPVGVFGVGQRAIAPVRLSTAFG